MIGSLKRSSSELLRRFSTDPRVVRWQWQLPRQPRKGDIILIERESFQNRYPHFERIKVQWKGANAGWLRRKHLRIVWASRNIRPDERIVISPFASSYLLEKERK
jgi:hypothetical protein